MAAGLLLYGRYVAGGIRKAVSPAYWISRARTEDLYEPATRLLRHGNRNLRQIALTIDDGPKAQFANALLDVLKQYGVRATFFVVGEQVAEYPNVVRRMIAEGHEVGNHTEHHLRLDTLSPRQIKDEIMLGESTVERATGYCTTLFRPPGMRFNAVILKEIERAGFTTVDYTIGAKDAQGATQAEIVRYVLGRVENGSILLLHGQPYTIAVLPQLIAELKKRGYEFVTVSQMLGRLPKPVTLVANSPAKLNHS